MDEALPLSATCPPPFPPRRSQTAPLAPPLPPRLQTPPARVRTELSQSTSISPDITQTLKNGSESMRPRISPLNKSSTIPVTSIEMGESPKVSGTESMPSSKATPQPTATQNAPGLPALLLSLALKEPLERSHGRVSTLTAVQSFFQSKLPAPPPFEYSSLVDHALLASQIALHDPKMRQQKRLPIVASLSVCAFLIAATNIVPRSIGWGFLALATYFGPGRFLVMDLWYISVGLFCLGFLVDIFPMLSLGMLLWIGTAVLSRWTEQMRHSGERRQIQSTSQFIGSTTSSFQNFDDTKRVALDVVLNISEWWTFRQSEPERERRRQKKAAKQAAIEEKKAEELRRAESIKQEKQALLDQKAAEKLKKAEEEKELKRVQAEMKAEKQRRKEEELERIRIDKENAIALKRIKSEQKALEKEAKKQEKSTTKGKSAEKTTEKPAETGHLARETARLAQEAARMRQEAARLNGISVTEETSTFETLNDVEHNAMETITEAVPEDVLTFDIQDTTVDN